MRISTTVSPVTESRAGNEGIGNRRGGLAVEIGVEAPARPGLSFTLCVSGGPN
jgi:hypothetical protein